MADRQDSRTCDYVARKEDPSNWHGDDPDDWVLEDEAPQGLEQEVWECPHEALDGEEHCPFHTDPEDVPDDVDEGQRFVEAVNEASAVDDEETARRRKEFVGATFGAFDIENATLDAGDEHPIRLNHARFTCGVNAENVIFEHNVLATLARFETGDGETTGEIGQVSFESAEFGEGEVLFKFAEFGEGEVSFNDVEFGEGEVSFNDVEFGEGEVSFDYAEFGEGEVSFDSAEFGEGRVSFDSAEFGGGEVFFNSAEFGGGEVFFNSAEFGEGRVSFDSAEFGEGEVFFNSAEFGEGEVEVSFERAEFGEREVEVSFKFAEFGEGRVSFDSAEFGEGGVSFKHAEFGGGEVLFDQTEFGERDVSFVNVEFGEGEVSFVNVEFGEGEVSFDSAEFGERDVSFDSTTAAASLSFLNTRFDAESTVVLSDAEFRNDVTFGFDDGSAFLTNGKNIPYVQHSMDFSGATFHGGLEFRSGTDSTTGAEQSDSGEPQFNFVFAGDVDFSNVTFPDGVGFSATRFPPDVAFTDATLEDADLSGADVTGADDFSAASFDGANLTGANFSNANLRGASFERAHLSRAELLEANFAGAKLYGALLGDARINRGTEFWLAEDDTRREPDGSPGPVRAFRRVKMAFRERAPYCPYDPRYRGSDCEPNLEKAGEMYATPENLARDNSLPGLASECLLDRKDASSGSTGVTATRG